MRLIIVTFFATASFHIVIVGEEDVSRLRSGHAFPLSTSQSLDAIEIGVT